MGSVLRVLRSGVGAAANVPNAVAGDCYFDTDSGELHKITGG